MSNRLDQEREKALQPIRILDSISTLENIGFKIIYDDKTKIKFIHNGYEITFYPYSGWHTGKGIKDGRGIKNLLKQIK